MLLRAASSPSQSLTRQIPPFVAARHLPPERGKSFLKVGALGSPRKLHLFTKSFPFKEGLSAQGVSGVTGNFVAMPKALPLGELAR